jgi:NAD(P)-dependent dehydrogenase (short-subunit alcohol dehydrogenase family)
VKEFRDKVAVVTGAASGIGRALAERCVAEGMKVVLADVEAEALSSAEAALKVAGARVCAVVTDVSKAAEVEALARKTLSAFGAVHLLCNNAGVATGSSVWESSLADWEWVLGVNLWGVIHGVRAFVPLMLEQEARGHIVNTASMAGLIAGPELGPYRISKHAVVALSETLYHQLAQRRANVDVSVLCPGSVRTRITSSTRNRPAGDSPEKPKSAGDAALREAERRTLWGEVPPAHVADHVFAAIQANRFYVFTHPDLKERLRARMEDLLDGRNPAAPEQVTGPAARVQEGA